VSEWDVWKKIQQRKKERNFGIGFEMFWIKENTWHYGLLSQFVFVLEWFRCL
jgi:hypothetical protein